MPSEIILDGVRYQLVPVGVERAPVTGADVAEAGRVLAGYGKSELVEAAFAAAVEKRMASVMPWTVREVAQACGRSELTIRREVKRRRIKPIGKTKPYAFTPEAVRAYIDGGRAQ